MSSIADVLEALEEVDWRTVDGISVSEAAAISARLQEADQHGE
jgi:hypothetical protein